MAQNFCSGHGQIPSCRALSTISVFGASTTMRNYTRACYIIGMPKTTRFAWFWAAGMPKTRYLRGFGQLGRRKPRYVFAWLLTAGMPKTTLWRSTVCVLHALPLSGRETTLWRSTVCALHALPLSGRDGPKKSPQALQKFVSKQNLAAKPPFPRRILAFHRAPPDIPC